MQKSKLKEITYFKGIVDYDSNTSECLSDHDGDYCRCKTVSPVIKEVYYDYIYQEIVGYSGIKSILEYGVDRLIQSLNINDFHAYGESGYYGEEVAIDLKDSGKEKLNKIYSLEKYSDKEIIKLCLESEYGFLLDSLANKKIKTLDIPLKDIILPTDQYKRVDQDVVTKYCNRDEIWLLCKEVGLKFSLVDGYHRYAAAKKTNKKQVKIIVFYD